MFGRHSLPLQIKSADYSLSLEKSGNLYLYKREARDKSEEKLIAGNFKNVLINPVEPVNSPKALTPLLSIELESALMIAPEAEEKVYVKFPIEVGVILGEKDDKQVLDVFALVRPKYTVYGDPRHGEVCRFWKSGVYTTIPETDVEKEGVIAASIANDSEDWAEVTKIIFNAYGMKIFYDEKIVAMTAVMKIQSPTSAETSFMDKPLKSGMQKSIELYSMKKLTIASPKYNMREGL